MCDAVEGDQESIKIFYLVKFILFFPECVGDRHVAWAFYILFCVTGEDFIITGETTGPGPHL
jgi:hypothetical protein